MNAEPRSQVMVVPDAASLSRAAAERFAADARAAIAARGIFTVALSGGSTPRGLYGLLAHAPSDWPKTFVFWGDERCVPPDHPESNYRLAKELLLDRVPIPAENIHRPRAELPDREAAANSYATEISRVVPSDAAGVPSFDLILLGLGADGHTASLLPGSALVQEEERLVAATDREREGMARLTVTPPILQHATQLLFLVAGSDKAEALWEVLEGTERLELFPAQVVRGAHGQVVWLVDRAAAALLSDGGEEE